ncbi:uncharacterized protein Tco025E_09382 [Trypanosoma conorhini]|uniref:Secreted protein n=1 Tax=Trypanosoma conorhini TaxID=83891 RepID=A0A422MX03_9TRYP|nr:uncharacterized protein Tco025E_09382 [Trypanosoma conorhini]RNE97755.1 hypothetical protein Tco025E_09382 [Trypanosoma conorhini]
MNLFCPLLAVLCCGCVFSRCVHSVGCRLFLLFPSDFSALYSICFPPPPAYPSLPRCLAAQRLYSHSTAADGDDADGAAQCGVRPGAPRAAVRLMLHLRVGGCDRACAVHSAGAGGV